uniref:EDS1 EP domain-containing protein n=1 Tax=Davidia involucrata TaxID=16924 RepID=A0A5B7BW51_DAVIN
MSSESMGNQNSNDCLQIVDYRGILEYLKHKAIYRGISELGEWLINPLRAGISIQLESVGVKKSQDSGINDIIIKIEERVEKFLAQKRTAFDPSKKLNDRKINMTYLEWYKKVSKDHGGYYDSYKNVLSKSRANIVKQQRILTHYWKEMVAEAEKMPQTEGASFRFRWLYAGTNYRRMVEPLDIAEYYKKGKTGYLTQGRSEHYVLLEQWLKDDKPAGHQNNTNERNQACSLTEDSCFWAHVEEAIISCKLLNDGRTSWENTEIRLALIKFEKYVMDLIKNYAASPEIFLEQSSFMKWWGQYQMITGSSHNSSLADFMRNRKYISYA